MYAWLHAVIVVTHTHKFLLTIESVGVSYLDHVEVTVGLGGFRPLHEVEKGEEYDDSQTHGHHRPHRAVTALHAAPVPWLMRKK